MSKNTDRLRRYRFKVPGVDPRPIGWPPPGPFWISGYSDTYVVVLAFANDLDTLTSQNHWPDAEEVEDLGVPDDLFSERFPQPSWWPIDWENDPWCGKKSQNPTPKTT